MIPESEALDRAELEELHRVAAPSDVAALGLRALAVGSAFVSVAGRAPMSAIVINRAIGLGLDGPASARADCSRATGSPWFDFGATAPAFRRRGSQAALLAARVERALDLGCRAMYTCTGVAVPGDPQHSYKNILKAGFREDYVRANYAPPRS